MKLRKLITVVLITVLVCVCFTACGEESSSEGVLNLLFPQGESSLTEEEQADRQQMLVFKCEKNDNSGNSQDSTEYRIYYSGRVIDEKTGKQSTITGSEFDKLKKYAEDIINKKIETKFDGGNESTNTTVTAYETKGTPYQLSAFGKCSIDGFDEMYKVVTDKFKG